MLSATDALEEINFLRLTTGDMPRVASAAVDRTDLKGQLETILEFASSHQLHVVLQLDVTHGYPDWITYAFHLQDREGHCVWCYDNAPHHREVTTLPHHKHRW